MLFYINAIKLVLLKKKNMEKYHFAMCLNVKL